MFSLLDITVTPMTGPMFVLAAHFAMFDNQGRSQTQGLGNTVHFAMRASGWSENIYARKPEWLHNK